MHQPDETEPVSPDEPPPRHEGNLSGRLVAGRYEVRQRLGVGGQATVYRVFDRLLGIEVALKVVHRNRDSARALARLRREVLLLRDNPHPALLRVIDLGRDGEDIYLAMELMAGGSLRERLKGKTPLPTAEAVRIVEALLEGLAALHEKGAVHRDVTPGNILFSEAGEAKLADFGLARPFARQETTLTREGTLLGTLGYRSPEQSAGQTVGPRSDLYSAGVVLFEMLAGHRPEEAAQELGGLPGEAPNLKRIRPELPRYLDEITARLLEPKPADRFPDARAVLAALREKRPAPRFRLRRRLFRAAVFALTLLPPFGVLIFRVPPPRFARLVPLGERGIRALDASGNELWRRPEVIGETANRTALARISLDGPRLLAAVLTRPGQWAPKDVSSLSFLDPDSGRLVKEVTLPSGADYFPHDPPRFYASAVTAVDLLGDGRDEVLVSYAHIPEAPSYVVLYVPSIDRARVVFFGRGGQGFQGAADLDGDGAKELLFGGVNNGWNWVNAVAAVKLDPRPLELNDWIPDPAAAPDVATHPIQERFLLWYAILPRGHFDGASFLSIDEARREIVARYNSGKTWTLDFDGFPVGQSPGSGKVKRQSARRETYIHLRESARLRRAGAFDLARREARSARESAARAGERWLSEYAERLEAMIFVSEGRLPEAEAEFARLAASAEDAPEVAYDAAVVFHLAGDLDRAVAWYERGIGRASTLGAGKSKHEFLKGEVMALAEAGRFAEGLAAVERFGAAYPNWQSYIWIFREFVRWRAGERPELPVPDVPSNWPDEERYWALEFKAARGGEAVALLTKVDRFLVERPECRPELLSLRAELLARMGKPEEAAAVARSALRLIEAEKGRRIGARGHVMLVAERARRLVLEKDSP